MLVYEGYDVYGPYKRKDGRQHVILIRRNESNQIEDRKTVSYPKYLVEEYLNKYLLPDETIDHIDGNFSNNLMSNLRIVKRSEHCRSHTSSKPAVIKTCVICKKKFTTTDNHRVTCGSKRCAGKCAHINGYNEGNSFCGEENKLISNRSLVEEIQSVESANSGKPLVGNPEQEDYNLRV